MFPQLTSSVPMLIALSCTDGGGVKGYSSLLILEQLMDEIKRFERGDTRDFDKVESSMSCPWSECVTDPEDADFFMHHYVDYFFGTSTGG